MVQKYIYLKKGNGKLAYQFNIKNRYNNRKSYFEETKFFIIKEKDNINELEMEYLEISLSIKKKY